MPIPTLPSLSLGFGSGPSQAINNAGPINTFGYTGPFSAGSGRGGSQTNDISLRQTSENTNPETGPFNQSGLGESILTYAIAGVVIVAGFAILKKVR